MNPSEWERAKALLAEAATLPAADRVRFVIEHCPDEELRREVIDLLDSPAALTGIVAGHALQPGARVGPYVIETLLGSGGMGEVYRARDGTLNRCVAIKVLPDPVADDPGRRSRFRREAQILAALNHPNIAHIHGFEEFGGVDTLVMELVDGPTLADTIAHHALTLTDALAIARQIIDALDAAHGQGIVHRDLKPANIKIRDDGTVKVLDFGLAKALASRTPSGTEAVSSPTASVRSTEAGLVLGTAPYMAPEQALGKTVDKRADIWSFGCVLFEMLSGRRAFAGKDVSDTLSLVIGKDPDWTALPSNTPAPIARVLRQCLHKDRSRRLADIADARFAIEEALTPSTEFDDTAGVSRAPRPAVWWRALPWVLAAATGGALAFVLLSGSPSRTTPMTAPLHLTADLAAGAVLSFGGTGSSLALSPNGTELAFIGHNLTDGVPRLFVRHLERQEDAALLPETDGAMSPFFSPDGQWLAFFGSGKLKKISVSGGAPITLCDAPNARGGDWGDDGTIFFSADRQSGLSRVSSAGGAPVVTTTLDAGELTQRFPQVLPGGKALLYTSLSPQGDFDFDKGNLVVQPLPSGVRKVVQRGAYFGRYVPSGHLIFLRNGTLFAQGFDLARLEVTSAPIPVIDNVAGNTTLGAGLFAVSNAGMLAYAPAGTRTRPIESIDRFGKVASLQSASSDWSDLAFAPDGSRLAYPVWDGKLWDIWVADLARGAPTRLTSSNSHTQSPVWTPDGRRIAFASQRGERKVSPTFNLYWQRADGSGDVQRLTTSENMQAPGSWHPNGKVLAFEERTPSHFNVMLLAMEGDEASGWRPGTPTTLLSADFDQRAPAFSPDGRWLAYESSQSGQLHVYVRAFPGPGSQVQISTGGGVLPKWSRTRRELLYSTFDGQIMIVSYSVAGASFKAELPRPWPGARYTPRGLLGFRIREFDLHPDGNRLALVTAGAPGPPIRRFPVRIFLNFFDELQRTAPPRGK